MARPAPTMQQMRAFKIGARARKFALEGCAIEGYEILLTAIAEAEQIDPGLLPLLREEMRKYDLRLDGMNDVDAEEPPPGVDSCET